MPIHPPPTHYPSIHPSSLQPSLQPLSIYSPWQPSTHPSISPFIHSSMNSHITPSFIHLCIHPSDTYSLNTHHPSILLLIHPFIYSCIQLSFSDPSIYLPTYLSIHWLMAFSIYPLIYLSNPLSTILAFTHLSIIHSPFNSSSHTSIHPKPMHPSIHSLI